MFYAVIIIVVVFAPLFTLEGVEGKLFQPMVISIVLAMLASLVVALAVMPALATYAFRRGLRHRTSPVVLPLEWPYRRLLKWALQARWVVVLVALAIATGSPLPLLPVQLLWLNLVTNRIQDGCALGCDMACAKGADDFELQTGPDKGKRP